MTINPYLAISRLMAILLITLGSYTIGHSQDYSRNGITYVDLSTPPSQHANSYYEALGDKPGRVAARFDDNRLPKANMTQAGASIAGSNIAKIQADKTANKVVDLLFGNDEGAWSMDRLIERAKYNLSDAEVVTMEAQFKGMERGVQDAQWIEPLIKDSYLISFKFTGIKSYKEMYDATDARNKAAATKNKTEFKPVERTHYGYRGSMAYTLYQIDFNEEILNEIFTKCWADANSTPEQLAQAKANRLAINYPLKQVYNVSSFSVSSSVEKSKFKGNGSKQGLMNGMVGSGLNRIMGALQDNVARFQISSGIYSVDNEKIIKKAYAKVGKKEGIKIEDRYFVYENAINASGKEVLKSRGVLRAYKVTDNRTIASGETVPTEFIQVYGQKLGPGMTIKESKDIGTSFVLAGSGNMHFHGRIEGLISKGSKIKGRGVNLFLELSARGYKFEEENIEIVSPVNETVKSNATLVTFGIGLSKELNLARSIIVQPFMGIRFGRVNLGASVDTLNRASLTRAADAPPSVVRINGENVTVGYAKGIATVDLGVRAGIWIAKKAQLLATLGFSPLATDGSKEGLFSERINGEANPYYVERSPVRLEFGIRFTP